MANISSWHALGKRVLREIGEVDSSLIVNAKYLPEADAIGVIAWLKTRLHSDSANDAPADARSAVEIARGAGYDLLGPFEKLADYLPLKRYYRAGESLCKFDDKSRVKRSHIFWFVRHDAETIQPLESPHRHDTYGTSVMSFEVNRVSGDPRLCNRYNHVAGTGCDNTLGSNVERIAPGLRAAIERDYGIRIGRRCNSTDIDNAIEFDEGKRLYVHDAEIGGIHICYAAQNALIDGAVRDHIALIGPLMIDLKEPRESVNLSSNVKCLDGLAPGVRVVIHANEDDATRAHERRPDVLHVVPQRRPNA